jgi:hypothetical protein
MPAVHCGEAIFDEHAQVLHTATDVSECDRIGARIRKLVRRLVARAALCLRQYTNHPNLVVDLEHRTLQRDVGCTAVRHASVGICTRWQRCPRSHGRRASESTTNRQACNLASFLQGTRRQRADAGQTRWSL